MSGGAYQYVHFQIENIELQEKSDPRRMAFQKLLKLIAEAMHDIEWVDSGDMGAGDEHKAIDACFMFLGSDPTIIAKAHSYDRVVSGLERILALKKERKKK